MNFTRHTGVQGSLRGCYMHREGQECHNRDRGCAWEDEAALYRPPCPLAPGVTAHRGSSWGQGFPWSLPPGRHAPEIGIPREGHSVVNHRSQRTIRHSRAREWVGVLESLLTSLAQNAQNGRRDERKFGEITPNLFERTGTVFDETA